MATRYELAIEVDGHDDAWPYEDVASVLVTISGAVRNGVERDSVKLGDVTATWEIARIPTPLGVSSVVPLRAGWETDRSGPPDSYREAEARGYGRGA